MRRSPARTVLLFVAASGLAACGSPSRLEGEACVASSQCAPGLLCDLGAEPHVCRQSGTPRPDADLGAPDGTPAPDADPGAPDARPAPDAGVPDAVAPDAVAPDAVVPDADVPPDA